MPARSPVRTPRIVDVVGWRVDPTPVLVRAGAVARLVGGVVLELAASSAAGPVSVPASLRRPRIPADPGEPVDLGPVGVEGTAPWLPPRWPNQAVACYVDRAAVNPTGFDGAEVAIPLDSLTVLGCVPAGRGRGRHATARWVLALEGEETRVDVTGPWLALAWLGHLGGWKDPT